MTEKELQNNLVLLASHIRGLNITQELSVPSLKDNRVRSRRFDIVIEFSDKVWLIELKSKVITWEDIGRIIGERAYLEIANKYFNPKPVYLIISSPKGINNSAIRLMKDQKGIYYCDPGKIARALISEYQIMLPNEASWRVDKLNKEFNSLLVL